MKKIIAILLLLATVFSLAACNKKYKPVESTEEEARTVMTLELDGKKYDVKYELYRALFLTYKNAVDGGDESVWSGDNSSAYVEKINEMIVDGVIEIYSAFALCERIHFDLYSGDVEEKISEYIKISVEGGSYGNTKINGHDSYKKYLADLKAKGLNYSVQVLMFRYAIAIDAIDTYYIGTASSDDVDGNISKGALEYTKEDVEDFYNSDDCVRVLRISVQTIMGYQKAQKVKDALENAASSKSEPADKETAVTNAIMGNGLYTDVAEVKNGYVIGRYNLDRFYFGDMTDAAFALNEGDVSDPVEIIATGEDSYYILYRTFKSGEHFNANYENIKYIYLTNCVGKISHGVAEELRSSVLYTEYFESLDHSRIGM